MVEADPRRRRVVAVQARHQHATATVGAPAGRLRRLRVGAPGLGRCRAAAAGGVGDRRGQADGQHHPDNDPGPATCSAQHPAPQQPASHPGPWRDGGGSGSSWPLQRPVRVPSARSAGALTQGWHRLAGVAARELGGLRAQPGRRWRLDHRRPTRHRRNLGPVGLGANSQKSPSSQPPGGGRPWRQGAGRAAPAARAAGPPPGLSWPAVGAAFQKSVPNTANLDAALQSGRIPEARDRARPQQEAVNRFHRRG